MWQSGQLTRVALADVCRLHPGTAAPLLIAGDVALYVFVVAAFAPVGVPGGVSRVCVFVGVPCFGLFLVSVAVACFLVWCCASLCGSVYPSPATLSCSGSLSSTRSSATVFPEAGEPLAAHSETESNITECTADRRKVPRTSEFPAGQFGLGRQESPKSGRQLQPAAAAQNSDGPGLEVQMGGSGPRGHHQATAAQLFSPGRGGACGRLYVGSWRRYYFLEYAAALFSKCASAPGSFGPEGEPMALLPCLVPAARKGTRGLVFSVSTLKGCLLSSGQKFREGLSGSLHGLSRSKLGDGYADTPMVPTRAWLEEVRKFMRGDYNIGRGSTQRGLTQRLFCNDYKVSVYGRKEAIWRFEQKLKSDPVLRETFWTMSGLRLVCHCKPTQECHGDAIIREYRQKFLGAFDREASASEPPSSRVLNYLARLREEKSRQQTPSSQRRACAPKSVPRRCAVTCVRGDRCGCGEPGQATEVCRQIPKWCWRTWSSAQTNLVHPQSCGGEEQHWPFTKRRRG